MRMRIAFVGVLSVALVSVACGEQDGLPTGPSTIVSPPVAPANRPPTVDNMAVAQSAYRTARVTAAATDADGQVATGSIDWGDGTTTMLSSGFSAISRTHRYGRAQSYSVTLRVADDVGESTQMTRSVSITVPPEACLGISIIEVCARSTSDFKNVLLAAKAGDIVLAGFAITDGDPSVTAPLAFGRGSLTATFDFDTGRLTLSGETCTVPLLVCSPIPNRVIQF